MELGERNKSNHLTVDVIHLKNKIEVCKRLKEQTNNNNKKH